MGAVAAATALLFAAGSAHAALVAGTYGGQPVATDTATGLVWLNPSQTLGLSPQSAVADNPGYQLATLPQVESLLEDAGIPAADVPNGTISDPTPGDLLATTYGYGQTPWVAIYGGGAAGWEYESYGYPLDPSGVGADQEFIDARNPPLGSTGTYTSYAAFNNNLADSDSNNFDFLVTTVPEPVSMAMLGAVAAMLIRRHPRRTGVCRDPR